MGIIRRLLTTKTFSNVMTALIAISFYLIVSNFYTVASVFSSVIAIVSPFLYAIGLAYVLNSPISWFKEKIFYKFKFKNILSIFTGYLAFFAVIFGLFFAVLPEVVNTLFIVGTQFQSFASSINSYLLLYKDELHISTEISDQITSALSSVTTFITNYLVDAVPKLVNVSFSVISVIVQVITTLIASIYMLSSKDKLVFQCKKFLFAFSDIKVAHKIMYVSNKCNRIFASFIVGKIIDSIIIGIITFFAMLFIYPSYAVLFSIVIGITNIIPYFGPFIGAIPCSLLLLMIDTKTMFIFIIFILVLQQVDGNIIGPKILGDSTGISAIWVLVSIIIGGALFGFMGMFMGIPTFAVIYELVSEKITKRLNKKDITYSDTLNMIIIPEKVNKQNELDEK